MAVHSQWPLPFSCSRSPGAASPCICGALPPDQAFRTRSRSACALASAAGPCAPEQRLQYDHKPAWSLRAHRTLSILAAPLACQPPDSCFHRKRIVSGTQVVHHGVAQPLRLTQSRVFLVRESASGRATLALCRGHRQTWSAVHAALPLAECARARPRLHHCSCKVNGSGRAFGKPPSLAWPAVRRQRRGAWTREEAMCCHSAPAPLPGAYQSTPHWRPASAQSFHCLAINAPSPPREWQGDNERLFRPRQPFQVANIQVPAKGNCAALATRPDPIGRIRDPSCPTLDMMSPASSTVGPLRPPPGPQTQPRAVPPVSRRASACTFSARIKFTKSSRASLPGPCRPCGLRCIQPPLQLSVGTLIPLHHIGCVERISNITPDWPRAFAPQLRGARVLRCSAAPNCPACAICGEDALSGLRQGMIAVGHLLTGASASARAHRPARAGSGRASSEDLAALAAKPVLL